MFVWGWGQRDIEELFGVMEIFYVLIVRVSG